MSVAAVQLSLWAALEPGEKHSIFLLFLFLTFRLLAFACGECLSGNGGIRYYNDEKLGLDLFLLLLSVKMFVKPGICGDYLFLLYIPTACIFYIYSIMHLFWRFSFINLSLFHISNIVFIAKLMI